MRTSWVRNVVGVSLALGVAAHPRVSAACGGCFLPRATTETSVVTGHRMAFAISTARTVLWDQIQYSGDPAEFSWVLPVRGEATLEAAEDAWFEALDAVSSPRISPPQLNCLTTNNKGGCDGCGAIGGASSDSASGGGGPSRAIDTGVSVTHEGAVGPYAYVQLSATSSDSLARWLPANGYVVPESTLPVIAAYVDGGFEFIALKLRPGFGTRQMTPVRVVTKGASPTLPLRMVAAGTGATVGITLYVISESRFEATGFANTAIDPAKLTFDWSSNRSNYAELRSDALASGSGSTWLTTFAARAPLGRSWSDALGQQIVFNVADAAVQGNGSMSAQTLAQLYGVRAAANAGVANRCVLTSELTSSARVVDTCVVEVVGTTDAGGDGAGTDGTAEGGGASDAAGESGSDGAAARDADARAAAASDARADAARPAQPQGVIPKPVRVCGSVKAGEIAASKFDCDGDGFTDISAALIGMHPADVWITRLDANLPRAALAQDLTLQSAASQTEITNALRAVKHINPPCELLEDHPLEAALRERSPGHSPVAHASLGFLSALGLLIARRLARKSA